MDDQTKFDGEVQRLAATPCSELVDACAERDETRRWLMEIAMQMGVPVASPVDHLGTQHEAWRRVRDRILERVLEDERYHYKWDQLMIRWREKTPLIVEGIRYEHVPTTKRSHRRLADAPC